MVTEQIFMWSALIGGAVHAFTPALNRIAKQKLGHPMLTVQRVVGLATVITGVMIYFL